jgi:fibronectin type 3 domain-containing protein
VWLQTRSLDLSDEEGWKVFDINAVLGTATVVSFLIRYEKGPGTLWIDDFFLDVIDWGSDVVPPNPPTNFVASRQTPNSVKLSWQNPAPASDGDLPCLYKIYRSTNRNVEAIDQNLVAEVGVLSEQWFDYTVLDNVRYYYKIVGFDKKWNFAESNEAVSSEQIRYGKNLIKNGGFENWIDEFTPDEWIITGRDGSIVRDSQIKHDGNYSLRIDNLQATEYNYVSQWFGLEANKEYVLHGWIKGDGVVLGAPNSQGAKAYITVGEGSKLYSGTFDWQEIRTSFTLNSAASCGFLLYLNKSKGTVWFDEIGLYDYIDGIIPESPIGFQAERINGTNKVKLTWAPSPEAPDGDLAEKYLIYRGISSGPLEYKGEVIAKDTNNFWVDGDASWNKEFSYSIIAVDKAGNRSEPCVYSVDKMGSLKGRIISEDDFAPLEGVTIKLEELDISTDSNADGEFEFLSLNPGNYHITINKPFYQIRSNILVVVTDSEDTEPTDYSLRLDNIKPNKPRSLNADGDLYVGLIRLEWLEPIEASDGETASSYNIYRATSENIQRIPEQKIATVTELFFNDIIEPKLYGTTFYYIVESIDGAENISEESSDIAFATVKAPPKPVLVSPKNRELFVDNSPIFAWEYQDSPDELVGFTIELSTDLYFQKAEEEECGDVLSFTWEKELKQGLWYWRIRALFDTGVKSKWSEVGSFVITNLEDNTSLMPYVNIIPAVFRNDSVAICYLLTKDARVELNIFNIGGKLIETFSLPREAGYNELFWGGKDKRGVEVPNGLYLIQLNVGEGKEVIRIMKKLVVFR